MIDVLEFVAAQHSGSSFNPDNTPKALEIAAYIQRRPFAVTKEGVASIARLARHALGSSSDGGRSAEHQLWLLTSGALNTAAGVHAFDGDAVSFFDAVKRDDVVRGKYLQRMYAHAAMQAHVAEPDAYRKGAAVDSGSSGQLHPIQLACASLGVVVAVFLGMLLASDTFFYNLLHLWPNLRRYYWHGESAG